MRSARPKLRIAGPRLGWPGLVVLLGLLGMQAALPLAQAWHLSGPAEAVSRANCAHSDGPTSPSPAAPGAPHDEGDCGICHIIAAVRQGYSPPPPVLIAVLHRVPEPPVELPAPSMPAPPVLRVGDPRGPPAI